MSSRPQKMSFLLKGSFEGMSNSLSSVCGQLSLPENGDYRIYLSSKPCPAPFYKVTASSTSCCGS